MAHDGIKNAFDKGADHVVIVTTPAGLSGIYNSMRIAMRDFPEDRITLIDSEQVSMGIAWQVLLGAEVAGETGDVDKTLAAIEQVRKHLQVYAVLTTLEFLRRSGRVSTVAASIGSLLGIKLVIQVKDGQILPVARVRTFGRALAKIVELITPHAPFDRLAIMHAINPEGGNALLERLGDTVPPDIRMESICPAIGVHGGPGIVGVATVSKGWKDAIGIGNAG
jgi:DegV family protein with EDD domain